MKIAAVEEILSVGYVTAPSKTISKYFIIMFTVHAYGG